MYLVVFVDYLLIDFDVSSDHEQWLSFESFRESPRLSLLLTLSVAHGILGFCRHTGAVSPLFFKRAFKKSLTFAGVSHT